MTLLDSWLGLGESPLWACWFSLVKYDMTQKNVRNCGSFSVVVPWSRGVMESSMIPNQVCTCVEPWRLFLFQVWSDSPLDKKQREECGWYVFKMCYNMHVTVPTVPIVIAASSKQQFGSRAVTEESGWISAQEMWWATRIRQQIVAPVNFLADGSSTVWYSKYIFPKIGVPHLSICQKISYIT